MALGEEKYVALTTYRKDGSARVLPVWIADLGDGQLGFTTGSTSYKVERIRNDDRVQLQPSDSKGKTTAGSSAVDGTAVVATGGDYEEVKAAIKAKYGVQVQLMQAFGKIRSLMGKGDSGDAAVIITLADS